MLIEEQIKIARMIASGTPREVAITEAQVTSSLDRTGAAPVDELKPQEKANLRTAVLKARQAELKRKQKQRTKSAEPVASASAAKPIEKAKSLETIGKDEGGATAALKMGKNVKRGITKGANLVKRVLTGRKVEKDNIDYDKLAKSLTNPTKQNPYINHMITDYINNPEKPPALPVFNNKVKERVDNAVFDGLDPRLFRTLGDAMEYDSFARNFHTMPVTTNPGDQKAFAEFCYGNMPSCKDGDDLQCSKNNALLRTS